MEVREECRAWWNQRAFGHGLQWRLNDGFLGKISIGGKRRPVKVKQEIVLEPSRRKRDDRQTDRQTQRQTDKPSDKVKNIIPFFQWHKKVEFFLECF